MTTAPAVVLGPSHVRDGGGYGEIHRTRPQTIGYGLVDSPVALCAWVAEKFPAWTDCDGDPENAVSHDQMLADISLYWLTGTGASAARLYRESIAQVGAWFMEGTTDTVDVPTDCAIFPKENPRPSRRWAKRRFVDIRQWSELPRGGHFAAFAQPRLFVDDVRSFFRLVREHHRRRPIERGMIG